MDTDSYADVVERLFKEFDWALSLPEIARLVSHCRQNGSGAATLEGLENEARSRLTDLALGARRGTIHGVLAADFPIRAEALDHHPPIVKHR